MTVALSLIAAVAWTMANYWLVPLSRSVDAYVASLAILVGNGICTIPLALALDGIPGRAELGPLCYALLAGVLEVGGFLFFFRALERGDLAVVAPIIGLEGGIAALAVFAASASAHSSCSASRSRSWAVACLPPRAGGARPPERCPRPALRSASEPCSRSMRRPRTSGPYRSSPAGA